MRCFVNNRTISSTVVSVRTVITSGVITSETFSALSDPDREMKENCHDHQRNNARNLAVHIRLHLPRVMNDSHSPRIYAIELDFRLRAFDARSRPNSLRVKALRMRPNGAAIA